jgi:1,4-dihydroxy-2-naphthoyl-CoA hydrolase
LIAASKTRRSKVLGSVDHLLPSRAGVTQMTVTKTPEFFNQISGAHLPQHLGIVVTDVRQGALTAEFVVRPFLLAPNGFMHGGSVVSLADTCAGYGCIAHLPEGATGFTTIELKCNYLGTAREGTVECLATAVHIGKTTQVWDATVRVKDSQRVLALFRCTQLVLYPKPS